MNKELYIEILFLMYYLLVERVFRNSFDTEMLFVLNSN